MNLPVPVIVQTALVGVWIAFGLFTLWISSRGWHWFLRLATLIVSVTPLLAIEAPDLMLAVLVCNLTMFFPVAYVCRRASPSDASQKSITPADSRSATQLPKWDLMGLLLGSASFTMVVALFQVDLTGQHASMLMAVLFGGIMAASLLFGVTAIYGPWSWLRRIAVCCGLFAVAVALYFAFDVSARQARQAMASVGVDFVSVALTVPWLAGVLVLATLLVFRTQWGNLKPKPLESKFLNQLRGILVALSKLVIAAMLVACLVSLSVVYSKLLESYPAVENESLLDRKNGFPELVDAGNRFSQSNVLEGVTPLLPGPQLRQELQRYQTEFTQVEVALNRELLTAKTWTVADSKPLLEGNIQYVSQTRSVARALIVKSRQEIYDGNFDIAIEDGCKCVKLRMPMSRSGVIVNALIGFALESIGLTPIQNATADASVEKLQDALALLKEMDALPDDAGEILKSEKEEFWHYGNWKYRMLLWALEEQKENVKDALENSIRLHRANRRQLIASIALELFQRDQQRYPKKLSDLVPKYLDSVPQDPFALAASDGIVKYVLEKEGHAYTLYSIGPNGVDDGGRLNEEDFWDDQTGDINFLELVRISNEEYLADAISQSEPAEDAGAIEPPAEGEGLREELP